MTRPRVALVHDYIVVRGGAERVLLSLTKMFPSAHVYTAIYRPQTTWPEFARVDVRPLLTSRIPVNSRTYRPLIPLYAAAFKQLSLKGFDLVLSSSSAFAKSAGGRAGRRVCYCYTPPRFLWPCGASSAPGSRLEAVGSRVLQAPLRRADLKSARRVDDFVAISQVVARRIRQFYGREATVVHPPYLLSGQRHAERVLAGRPFLLGVGRLVRYKGFDQLVSTGLRLDVPVVLVGTGPEEAALRARGGPMVNIMSEVSDSELAHLYASASAVVIPGEEDWGMAAIEANAFGCPVVAARRGGAEETVVEMLTGCLYTPDDPNELDLAVRRAMDSNWDLAKMRDHVDEFSEARFHERLAAVLGEVV